MTDEERRQLAELFREDDRLRAENAEWEARRKAEREAADPLAHEIVADRRLTQDPEDLCHGEPTPVEKSGNGLALTYKTTENAMAAAPLTEDDVFDENQRETLSMIIAEARKDWDAEHAAEMAALRKELEQQLEHLERKMLEAVTRLIRPGENAELQCRDLSDRLGILEGRIQRQLNGRRKRVA